ncbi:hypothetical protein D3C73_795600 [compost metagenome]
MSSVLFQQVEHWVFVFRERNQIGQFRQDVVLTHPLTFEVRQDSRLHYVYGFLLITHRSAIKEVAVEVCFQAFLQSFYVLVVRFHLTFDSDAVRTWEGHS